MRRLGPVLALLTLSGGLAHAAGLHFGPGFTTDDLGKLTDAVGDVVTFPNLGTAASTGLAGFEILVAAGGPQVDTGSHWWGYVDGSTLGGTLYGQRVIVRKGLPLNLDVGVQAGQVLGERFWGGEVRWGLLEGGAVSPAVALRATYSRLAGSGVDVDATEAQLVISKGFLIVTPYAGMGFRRVSAGASFGDPAPVRHTVDADRWVGTVGARVTLLPFVHLVGEFRQGSSRSFYLGLGVAL
jgi:hypothetical protein